MNFAATHTIGGADPASGKTIAFNAGAGVFVSGGPASVASNRIFSNGTLGIDLDPAGVTANDPLDSDTGSNGLQNHPVLISAVALGTTATIEGTLASRPNASMTIEVHASSACDPSGHGEGEVPLHRTAIATGGDGNGLFSSTVATALLPGSFVTATATDATGNTSEMAACLAVACSPTLPQGTIDLDVERDRLLWAPSTTTASAYDVVTGDLASLRASGGDFAQSTDACLASGFAGTSLPYEGNPAAGEGTWFLVRGVNCAGNGTYDSGAPSQTGARDAEIAASGNACP